ncbi:MAG TPA: hydrogenase maturation nickel metallochaperone HypA [bacterium]|nr:hydrogenase maturation nickel metallochaperone HypA [bacterium]HOH07346.1 hydrogenase maturation nickel metallochaperone HypA [bacterium]HOY44844.1 hydrogenase maturation nickel metallochaperone HypA [bacterium]HPG83831.1 hydrogenase maturation nickel metallochaperone HypA [bacterium]HPM59028.1 hydrogenase maturation nickel metallochaperone HypA [bacterium]
MHEISVAAALMRRVLAEKEARKLERISQIVLQIGPMSGIMPDALQFAYDSLREGTQLEGTELVIHSAELTTCCRHCLHLFDSRLMHTRCPRCGSEELQIMGGDEFFIQYLVTEKV